MPYLIQRRVRNRQPQQAVRVKSEFYGTRAWLPGLLEASRQSDGILPNNAISQLGVSGKLTHAVTERFQLDSSAGFIPTAGGYTLALHFVYGGALGSGQGVGPRVVGGSLSLRATPYLGSSGIVSWDYGGATEGVSRCSAALPTSDGTIAAYVFTTGPRGMEIWSNGNKAASNAANPTRSDTSAYIYAVGDIYGGDSGSESFALVASIPYQVSEDVAQALSANPWQIFEDEEEYVWIPDVAGGSSTNLILNNASHSLVSPSVNLTLDILLAINSASNNHTSDSIVLTSSRLLSIASSIQSLISNNITLSTASDIALIINGAINSPSSTIIGLTSDLSLAINNSTHEHDVENIILSTQVFLLLQNAISSLISDNITLDLTATTYLTLQNASHNITSTSITLTTEIILAVIDSLHLTLSPSIELTSAQRIVIADALSAMYSEEITLTIPSVGGSCPTVNEIADEIMLRILAKNYLTLPQFIALK